MWGYEKVFWSKGSFSKLHLTLKVFLSTWLWEEKKTGNGEDLSASVFKWCKSIGVMILNGSAQNFFGQYASLKVFANRNLSCGDSIWRLRKVANWCKRFSKGVLSCKNGCTSNVCSSCFDYQENHNFFLELIETHIFVSQGIIKFERNTKIQMLKKLEGIFHAPLNHLSIIQSLKSRFIM